MYLSTDKLPRDIEQVTLQSSGGSRGFGQTLADLQGGLTSTYLMGWAFIAGSFRVSIVIEFGGGRAAQGSGCFMIIRWPIKMPE